MSPVEPLAFNLGPTEVLLIVLVVVLLFGAKKLPELARGSGRALRIFKAETKGLIDDDDEHTSDEHTPDEQKRDEQKQINAQRSTQEARPVESPAEQPRSETER
jgi:sec-independent protein translocase protein TatA